MRNGRAREYGGRKTFAQRREHFVDEIVVQFFECRVAQPVQQRREPAFRDEPAQQQNGNRPAARRKEHAFDRFGIEGVR